MSHRALSGVIPVLLTPLDADFKVDKSSLKTLCDYYSNKGVSGLWVLGTGGEDMCLSYQERLTVAEIVSECVPNNIKKIIGCSFFSPSESRRFLRDTRDFNFHAYHAMPYHPKVSLHNILDWYKLLADNASKPLWGYTSGNWAQHMGPDFIEKLIKIQNIEGVKYSSSNMVDVQSVINLQNENFQVITAVVKTFYACLALGVKAATTVEASVFYDQILQIYQHFIQGNLESAKRSQDYLNNVLLKYPSSAAKDNFLRVSELKYMLSLRDICKEHVSEFYRPLTAEEKQGLQRWFGGVGLS